MTQIIRPLNTGNSALVITDRGTTVEIRYAVVNADRLVASHDQALRPNPAFPKSLQPRDRSRIASEDQVGRIARGLMPELLGVSVKASDGAPIIGRDGLVESGNARTIALQRLYSVKSARAYQAWLIKQARSFGLDAKKIRAAQKPVLVRIRTSEVADRESFVRECNEASVAAMSDIEQARIDADVLTADLLATFAPDDNGAIATASNAQFIKLFVARVIAPGELGRFIDRHGELSQAGVRRIQNALITKAYGESSIVERMAEATDSNFRRIAAALLKKSAAFAVLNEDIARGARHDYRITDDVIVAVRKLSHLRETNQTVTGYLNQKALLVDNDLTALQRRLLQVLDLYNLSGRTIERILQSFIDQVDAFGHPSQRQIFSSALPTVAEVLEQAITNGTVIERKETRLSISGNKSTKKSTKQSRKTWDRAAAARKAWITIRKNRAAKLKVAA